MQKINFQDLPNTTTPVNATNLNAMQTNVEGAMKNTYTSSTTDTYSCDYINNSESYSINEVKTNKTWTNGKPIYRKVVEGTITTTDAWITIGSVSNAEELMKMEGVLAGYLPVPVYLSSNYFCAFQINSGNIQCNAGSGFASSPLKIIVEYTKSN